MTVIELREVFPPYGDTLLTAGQLQQPSDSQFVEELMLQTFFLLVALLQLSINEPIA
ncbi:hypothetical protein [Enterococcus gallinarum]|uniref:hypothetical protein n=1 Tax=Enterococcus TaxID=1350 RepID=UPI002891C4AE|nr:hypothetical protein [Enterococcus gallinarum]MDT2713938.1 hypothetical protein [Enterococcus gallinarum]